MAFRIFFTILLLLAVILLPFWVPIILGILGIIYFRNYLEAPSVFLISDLLYGVGESRFAGVLFVSFFASLAFLLIVNVVKDRTRVK